MGGSDKDPLWKRLVGGLIGIVILAAVLLFARSKGASGAQVQQWQEAIVIGAGAAGLLIFVILRRKR